MKKDKRVVGVHRNGLGDYKINMSIRSQLDMSGIMDLVEEMFEQSELYNLVKYNNPYFSVKRIDSDEEISKGYYDEEPVKDRHLTNKELAMWLAQGKGLAMDKGTGRKFTSYDYWEEDKTVDYMNLYVRKWDDTKWNYPTYGYCFGEE